MVNGATVYPQVYLQFLPGGSGPDGVYTCGAKSGSNLQVYTPTTPTGTGVIVPQSGCAYFVDNPINGQPNTVTIFNFTNANVKPGDKLWLAAPGGTLPPAGVHRGHRRGRAPLHGDDHGGYSRNANYRYAYGLPAPAAAAVPLGQRRGRPASSTWATPTASSPRRRWTRRRCSISSTPTTSIPAKSLSANVTTPEFQLTTDTNIVTLTNTLNRRSSPRATPTA